MRPRLSGLLPLLLLLGGCVDFSPELRRHDAERLAEAAGWEGIRLPAGNFVLAAFVPHRALQSDILTVYVEGDGLSWISRSQVSGDPTPMHPVGLALAMRQPGGAAAYLARPCQFVTGSDAAGCESSWWTGRRFAPQVIVASDLAIDQLKQRFGARRLVLVGYSGGGAVAALVAARRHDVIFLATVAGNVDTDAWVRRNKLSALSESLNPADAWQALSTVPQLHFVGGRDRSVGVDVARSYQARFPVGRQPALKVIDGFDHVCCWVERWPSLYPLLAPGAS